MKTRSNLAIAASVFVFSALPALLCSALPSVTFVAGTSAGWAFYERDGDIARNNIVALNDLNVIAQNWLAQLSHFDGEIAIFQFFFLRSVSKSPKLL